jgi:hypothetical protein
MLLVFGKSTAFRDTLTQCINTNPRHVYDLETDDMQERIREYVFRMPEEILGVRADVMFIRRMRADALNSMIKDFRSDDDHLLSHFWRPEMSDLQFLMGHLLVIQLNVTPYDSVLRDAILEFLLYVYSEYILYEDPFLVLQLEGSQHFMYINEAEFTDRVRIDFDIVE